MKREQLSKIEPIDQEYQILEEENKKDIKEVSELDCVFD